MDNHWKWPQIEAACRYIGEHFGDQLRQSSYPPHFYEFGVYKGTSLCLMHDWALKVGLGKPIIWGIDSFEGLPPEPFGVAPSPMFKPGDYSMAKENMLSTDACAAIVQGAANYHGCTATIIRDRFAELKKWDNMREAALVHLDCDQYGSTRDALFFLFKNQLIRKHTLLAYDEFTTGGAGPQMAHNEALHFFGAQAAEIFHYCYRDKKTNVMVRQAVWEIC